MRAKNPAHRFSSIFQKAEKAMKEAVRDALKDHALTGDPVYIWKNGRVVKADPAKLLRKVS